MKAKLAEGVDANTLLDPTASEWGDVKAETLKLEGTPVGMQPTEMIRSTWKDKKIGTVGSVSIKALHNGEALAFRLEWAKDNASLDNGDNTSWPDGAAVAFPVTENAALITMGAPDNGINAWFWRADGNGTGRQVIAEGIGTSDTVDLEHVRAQADYRNGHWSLTLVRALQIADSPKLAQLTPGETTGFGIAIWDGANGERGGIKAYSGPAWLDLELE
jgi:DMSO reductase family type II enzyme heme b subunit